MFQKYLRVLGFNRLYFIDAWSSNNIKNNLKIKSDKLKLKKLPFSWSVDFRSSIQKRVKMSKQTKGSKQTKESKHTKWVNIQTRLLNISDYLIKIWFYTITVMFAGNGQRKTSSAVKDALFIQIQHSVKKRVNWELSSSFATLAVQPTHSQRSTYRLQTCRQTLI